MAFLVGSIGRQLESVLSAQRLHCKKISS